jgi:hypothetical protein
MMNVKNFFLRLQTFSINNAGECLQYVELNYWWVSQPFLKLSQNISRVNVMITIFINGFRQFSAKNWRFSRKTML